MRKKANPKIICLLFLISSFIIFSFTNGQSDKNWTNLYVPYHFNGMPYRLMKPFKNDNNSKNFPLILSLHGGGSLGTNNTKQLKIWNKILAGKDLRKKYPTYVVCPQVTAPWHTSQQQKHIPSENELKKLTTLWSNYVKNTVYRNNKKYTKYDIAKKVIDLVSYLTKNYSIDKNNIYCVGHSMGGRGTLNLLSLYPEIFKKGISSAGQMYPWWEWSNLKDTPIWMFHGSNDKVAPFKIGFEIYGYLKNIGAPVRFSELRGRGHNISSIIFLDENIKRKGEILHTPKSIKKINYNVWDWLFEN